MFALTMDSFRRAIVPESILRGMFHMIENNDLRSALLRFQLEPELVLYRFEKSRPRGIGLRIRDSGLRRHALGRPFEGENEISAQPCSIDHGPFQLSHSR